MRVKITVRNGKIKQAEHDYILEKIEKLDKTYVTIEHVDVIIVVQKYLFETELHVKTNLKDFLLKKTGENVAGLIDVLVDKMAYQLRKYKGKIKEHHIPSRNKKAASVEDIPSRDIIATPHTDVPVMTQDEAINELERDNTPFVLYRDVNAKCNYVLIKVGKGKYQTLKTQ